MIFTRSKDTFETVISNLHELKKLDFAQIWNDPFWNTGESKELKMHRIHAYPAKFPAFITTKALTYAKENLIKPKIIADIFCGCGTVAFESKRNNINFWGCDINPVAGVIARAKSQNYKTERLKSYFNLILQTYQELDGSLMSYDNANQRLKYWYDKKQFEDLTRLKKAIEKVIPARSKYFTFYMCAFSNILKPTSRWLTKSIKPQLDPKKRPADVIPAFEKQCQFMIAANEESDAPSTSRIKIVTANFLDKSIKRPKVDMIITSPPYVTSYEYADLHQLSSLWLGYAEDYRDLRDGSIGSLHHSYNFEREFPKINDSGREVVLRLLKDDISKARSVAKYFLDIQETSIKSQSMLTDNGIAVFIIGDTEYKGVRIENARHLVHSLLESGFSEVKVTKRRISGKILTPYRDVRGRFTTDSNSRKVYGEEFIVIAKKRKV